MSGLAYTSLCFHHVYVYITQIFTIPMVFTSSIKLYKIAEILYIIIMFRARNCKQQKKNWSIIPSTYPSNSFWCVLPVLKATFINIGTYILSHLSSLRKQNALIRKTMYKRMLMRILSRFLKFLRLKTITLHYFPVDICDGLFNTCLSVQWWVCATATGCGVSPTSCNVDTTTALITSAIYFP